jgi:hypothetical protein
MEAYMKRRPKKDPKTYFSHLARDLHDGFTDERDPRLDSWFEPDDILAFCGVCQLHLQGWPEPVLIAFDSPDSAHFCLDDEGKEIDDSEADAARDAWQMKVLAQLRKGLAKVGLEELACYDKFPPGYALVAQLVNPKHDLKKAARELTKLVWDLAE